MLEWLKSADFYEKIGYVSSPSALRRCLHKLKEIQELRDTIATGGISEGSVREFAELLSQEFEKGKHFPHELPLAALCVALEDRKTPFVEEFLLDLARLKVVEMPLVPAVARESLQHWIKLPRVSYRTFSVFGVPKSIANRVSRSPTLVPQPLDEQTPLGVRFHGTEHAFA